LLTARFATPQNTAVPGMNTKQRNSRGKRFFTIRAALSFNIVFKSNHIRVWVRQMFKQKSNQQRKSAFYQSLCRMDKWFLSFVL